MNPYNFMNKFTKKNNSKFIRICLISWINNVKIMLKIVYEYNAKVKINKECNYKIYSVKRVLDFPMS